MSTETSKWQILGFCTARKLTYSFMGYATLSKKKSYESDFFVDFVDDIL
jgi:hypothetical protein